MEWSWKTLLILIVIALMIGILIDGFRRMRRNQAAALRLDVKSDFNLTDDDEFNSELPSGGARVVSHARTAITESTAESVMNSPIYANDDDSRSHTKASDEEHALSVDDDDRRSHESSLDGVAEQADEPSDDRSCSDNGENADTHTPIIAETSKQAEHDVEKEINTKPADEPAPVLLNVEEMGSCPEQLDNMADSKVASESVNSTKDNGNAYEDEHQEQEQANHQPLEEMPIEPSATQAASVDNEPDVKYEVADPITEPEPTAVKVANVMRPGDHAERLDERESAQEVLVVHVIAQTGATFSGDDLLYVFNSCDLRLGERDIFHRFEENNGNGRVQFSVSQAYEPGSFDTSVLLSQSFSGLSFFMSLPGPKKPLDAYEAMSEMAQFVARNLKGDLLDESHSAMTMQTMEHHREKIMDFERKQRLKGKSK